MSTDNARREFIKGIAVAAAVGSPFTAAAVAQPSPSSHERSHDSVFNVLDHGAVGDGKSLCTAAIQRTVDTCASSGGGKVVVPAGRYLTGALFLKSNVHVEVLAGARLLFTTDFDSVPPIQGRWEGIDRTVYASMFTGMDLENVSITGRGVLDGQGETWWKAFRELRELRRKLKLEEREPENPPGSPLKWGRPRMINLYRCKNVLISGLTVVNSPSWNIHPVLCEDVVVDGVTITAPEDSPNTDGIDPDSCKNMRISNCYISVGDDCIIIKSGYKFQKNGVPSENITVANCVFGTGHAGVGIGSETSGGVRNVVISNCVCDGTDRGLRFKTARTRGNVVENVRASNFVMRGVGEPVVVTMFYTGGDTHALQPVNEGTPKFRNFHFSNIFATEAKRAVVIEGLPEMPIEGVSLNNVIVEHAATGISCTNSVHTSFVDVRIDAVKTPVLHVFDVRDLEVTRLATTKPLPDQPLIRMEGVRNASVYSCAAAEGTNIFLELKGKENRDISLMSNRLRLAARALDLQDGATESAITDRT